MRTTAQGRGHLLRFLSEQPFLKKRPPRLIMLEKEVRIMKYPEYVQVLNGFHVRFYHDEGFIRIEVSNINDLNVAAMIVNFLERIRE